MEVFVHGLLVACTLPATDAAIRYDCVGHNGLGSCVAPSVSSSRLDVCVLEEHILQIAQEVQDRAAEEAGTLGEGLDDRPLLVAGL